MTVLSVGIRLSRNLKEEMSRLQESGHKVGRSDEKEASGQKEERKSEAPMGDLSQARRVRA